MAYLKSYQSTISQSLVNDVIKEARSIDFPEEAIKPDLFDWVKAMALSRNTKPEFVFLASAGVIATLLGPKTQVSITSENNTSDLEVSNTVKHPQEAYKESMPLFLNILSEPGSGKSTAHMIAVQKPLEESAIVEIRNLVVQDYTKKGLFEHLVHHKGRGLISSAEMQIFFDNLMRKQSEGHGERQLINKLYDGVTSWSMTSAGRKIDEGRERREELKANSLCIVGFAQPQPFVEVYRPLKAIRDGFADRILVCTIKPKLLLHDEVMLWKRKLNNYSLQNFHTLYEQIYLLHENGREYVFSEQAFEKYKFYTDHLVQLSNASWEEGSVSSQNFNKDKRNLCRLAVVMHVFKEALENLLKEEDEDEMLLEDDMVPTTISEDAFDAAKEIIEYFAKQREALNKAVLVEKKKKNDPLSEIPLIADFMSLICDWLEEETKICAKEELCYTMKEKCIMVQFDDAKCCPWTKTEFIHNLKDIEPSMGATKVFKVGKKTKRGFQLAFDKFGESLPKLRKALQIPDESQIDRLDGACCRKHQDEATKDSVTHDEDVAEEQPISFSKARFKVKGKRTRQKEPEILNDALSNGEKTTKFKRNMTERT